MERAVMEGITERLASIEGLYFPGAVRSEPPPFEPSRRKSALFDLLSRDAPIFLERYGSVLTPQELQNFETLRTDYEVNWHLNRLQRTTTPPTQQSNSPAIKNRRRAYMEKLVQQGEYFSEDSMRERDPYLHHEYVGKFQDPVGRMMSRPGEKWSETLLRRCEEMDLVKKIRGEQIRRGVDVKDLIGCQEIQENQENQEEEEEEEEEEEDEEEEGIVEDSRERISEEELQEQMEQFTVVMQQKFLAGEDKEYLDYEKIDGDERLDDYWNKEANYDAEEKYFEED
ncbi:hypothetical protein LUZ60_007252 [Juncus effusus]|nr:hypothetical protein LUZ60_007252 [Juncus effusus]